MGTPREEQDFSHFWRLRQGSSSTLGWPRPSGTYIGSFVVQRTSIIALVLLLFFPSVAHADIGRFDLAGKLYTKWLFRNDDSQGTLGLGNPFWPDTITGNNGVGSEFELKIMGEVSQTVRAEVR